MIETKIAEDAQEEINLLFLQSQMDFLTVQIQICKNYLKAIKDDRERKATK